MARRKLSLIVADDNIEIANSVTEMSCIIMRDLGFDCCAEACFSAARVQEIAESKLPDVLITDHRFDVGMSGADLLSKLEDPFGDMYTLLMSGCEEAELFEVVSSLQSRDRNRRFAFVRKPVDMLVLRSRLIDAVRYLSERPLPFPLAYAEYRLRDETRPEQRFLLLRDLIESGARLWGFTLVASIRNVTRLDLTSMGFRRVGQLSLGSYIALIESALKVAETVEIGSGVRELLENTDKRFLKWLKIMNHWRNAEIGHPSALQDEGYYRKVLDKLEEPIMSLQHRLSLLRYYRLMVPEYADVSEGVGVITYRCQLLMGHTQPFPYINMRCRGSMQSRRVYGLTPARDPIGMHPLVRFEYCTQCDRQTMFMLHGRGSQGSGGKYVSVCPHSFEDPTADVDFLVGGEA